MWPSTVQYYTILEEIPDNSNNIQYCITALDMFFFNYSDPKQQQQSSHPSINLLPISTVMIMYSSNHPKHEHRQHFVQGVHTASLEPLGDGGTSMTEAQFLQDIIHTIWLKVLGSP